MATFDLPLIDLGTWRTGTSGQRAALAGRLDDTLRDSGFLLLTGHDIPASHGELIRGFARRFFALPYETKARYATSADGSGWIGQGRETHAFYGEDADPRRADLKETLAIRWQPDAGANTLEFTPPEVPELADACSDYFTALHTVYLDLLEMCASALGLAPDWFSRHTRNAHSTFKINRYPSLRHTGTPNEGQSRIGAHTDWGLITVLDRQVGHGGLEVQTTPGGAWASPPHVPGAFTVNIGDLMARWTGDRWRSTRHRVLPPPAEAPEEELISLIMFNGIHDDAVVSSLPEPIGQIAYPPVTAGEYLQGRAAATTVT